MNIAHSQTERRCISQPQGRIPDDQFVKQAELVWRVIPDDQFVKQAELVWRVIPDDQFVKEAELV